MAATPGPWIYDGENSLNQGFDVALPDGGVLATAYYCEDREGADEAEANAKLIAAAPELLETLKAIVVAARIDAPKNNAWQTLLADCTAAIAKATGD